MHQVIIAGGGLAGLLNAILLAKAGISCLVIEKKTYPVHKVCGEYISNEVKNFLQREKLYPEHLLPPQIDRLVISSADGTARELVLSMGGFGVSRYQLEHFWYQKALELGVEFRLNTSVTEVIFQSGHHLLTTNRSNLHEAPVVIGAFGKRTTLDKRLNRPFMTRRSAYLAVKYHLAYDWDPGVIALHAFEGGYCGISMIEEGKLNLCYLSRRANLLDQGSIDQLESQVLCRNPHIAKVLNNSSRLFPKPLVINEISFKAKKVVVDHVLMSGDAAGMITPLCGNGMAMAIHSATLLAPAVARFITNKDYTREQLEQEYSRQWGHHFARRQATGRYLQQAFFFKPGFRLLVQAARFPFFANWIVKQTHGEELRAGR